MPPTMVMIRARAEEIAAHLGVANFSASAGFIRRSAKRNYLVNVSLWGTRGSAAADVEASKQRMADIREDLCAYAPEQIHNIDEAGLYFRGFPYVTAGSGRRALGSKAIKARDHLTLVLAVNQTGSHKIPVDIIGKPAVTVCFQAPRDSCPLPYFFQTLA